MKSTFFFIALLVYNVGVVAQKRTDLMIRDYPNNINLNLFGDIGGVSINYERAFFIRKQFFMAGRAGFGASYKLRNCFYRRCTTPTIRRFLIPHHLTFNLKIVHHHFFEFGLGSLPIFQEQSKDYIFYSILGIRIFHPKNFREIFRVYCSIRLYHVHKDEILFIPFGMSMGVSF